jgi:hypothetical protein
MRTSGFFRNYSNIYKRLSIWQNIQHLKTLRLEKEVMQVKTHFKTVNNQRRKGGSK